MEIKVIWTDSARGQLEDIFFYYKENSSLRAARNLVQKIIDRTIQLESNPESGQVEPLLKGRKLKYRYIVEGNYKIIYWIDSYFVSIASIFDCRQNPGKMSSI